MSIIDDNQQEIVKLGTVHSAVFKVSLYVMPIILGYFVTMVLRHDTDIAVIKDRLAFHTSAQKPAPKTDPKVAMKNQPAE